MKVCKLIILFTETILDRAILLVVQFSKFNLILIFFLENVSNFKKKKKINFQLSPVIIIFMKKISNSNSKERVIYWLRNLSKINIIFSRKVHIISKKLIINFLEKILDYLLNTPILINQFFFLKKMFIVSKKN